MTWATLNAAIRERHAPLFAQAEALSSRLASAAALGTCHAPRLRSLRRMLRAEIAECNPIWLRKWIADFGEAIETECAAAHRVVAGERRAA